MSRVHHDAEVNRALVVTAPPGHPVGDLELTYFSDGTVRVELKRVERLLALHRFEFPVGGPLDVWVGVA